MTGCAHSIGKALECPSGHPELVTAVAVPQVLRPYQMVSIVPGCLCISRKTSLVRTLINTYGPEVAFTVVPRTFKLPEELDSWDNWIKKHPQQVRFWVIEHCCIAWSIGN